jgi:hypothetical protein
MGSARRCLGDVADKSQCGLAVDFTATTIHAEYIIDTPVIKMGKASVDMAYPCVKVGSSVQVEPGL